MTKEPAFPGDRFPASKDKHSGMSLRDYFAAKAMQAILSSPNCPMKVEDRELARQAYLAADAMLVARIEEKSAKLIAAAPKMKTLLQYVMDNGSCFVNAIECSSADAEFDKWGAEVAALLESLK